MAIAEIRKDTDQIKNGVKQIIDGTFSSLVTHEYHLKPTND